MKKELIISILQEAIEFHDDVEKAYLLPNPGKALQEKYGKVGAHCVFARVELLEYEIIICQLADWHCGNRNYWITITINGICLDLDIRFVKGLLEIIQE